MKKEPDFVVLFRNDQKIKYKKKQVLSTESKEQYHEQKLLRISKELFFPQDLALYAKVLTFCRLV